MLPRLGNYIREVQFIIRPDPEADMTVLAIRLMNLRDRDALVRAAYAGGMTKMSIHHLSGLARTTIDRILIESQHD